jgi:hypothetical protein
MPARYTIIADAFALTTTAKTACNVIASATIPFTIVEFGVSVDAATGRFLVELFESTQAGAGTATGTGAKQIGGYTAGTDGTPESTYGREYSAEPTALTVLKHWWCACPGPLVVQFPLGREPQSLLSGSTNHKALGIRVKVDTGTPNCDAYLEWEE